MAEQEQAMDKGYQLYITPDGMQAVLCVTDVMPYEFSPIGLQKLLIHEGVTTGIDKEALVEMVEHKKLNEEVIVAVGREPMNGKDGFFTYHFKRFLNTKPVIMEDGSVDYRGIDLFTFVEEGQLLAEYTKATAGTMGYTVRGKLLMPVRGREKPAIRGSGFTLNKEATEYYAKVSGKIEYTINKSIEDEDDDNGMLRQYISISPAYIHNGNFMYRDGDINFDGDVLIRGDIQSGATLVCTGNVTVEGTVESACIYAGKNVLIKKGVIGGGKGLIEARGNIRGTFFESVTIKSEEDIECNYLFNCMATSDKKIRVRGNMGSIIAGRTCAMMGIEAFSMGNESGVGTVLRVGLDDKIRNAAKELEKKIISIRTDIAIFEKNNFPESPFYSKIVLALEKRNEELKEAETELEEVQQKISKASKAYVIARGIVYQGVVVEVGNRRLELNEEFKGVNFKLHNDHVGMFYN